jgi:uncharacterized membrane protein
MSKRTGILIGLILLYAAVRLWRLTDACMWFDEIFGVHAAEHTWGGMWWFVAQDLIHPPLFYALLKVWIGIGGDGLLWLRLFPVLFSVLALIPFLYLCREIKLTTAATALALAFIAFNGSLIKYAQEVRMYSLLLCLSLFSIWLFARFFYRGKNIWILTIVNILIVHTHYFGWLVVLSEVIVIAVLQRIKIRHVLIMAGITAVAFVPWLVAVIRAAGSGSEVSQNIGWIKPPGFRALIELAGDLIEPFYFQVSSLDPTSIVWVSLPLLFLILTAAIIWIASWTADVDKESYWLLATFVLIPLFTAFTASWVSPYSVWGARHLIIIFAPAAILFAMFIAEIANEKVRWAFITISLALIAGAGVRYAATPPQEQIWCAWETLSESIPATEPQTVYAFEDLSAYHLWFAMRKRANVHVVKVDGMQGMSEDRAYFLPRGFDEVRRIAPAGIAEEQFWVAFRDMRWDERHPPVGQLAENGFNIGEPITVDAGGIKAFIVQAKRK